MFTFSQTEKTNNFLEIESERNEDGRNHKKIPLEIMELFLGNKHQQKLIRPISVE